ncbi:hypothetical protein [Acinetobacter guillouiae]|uniref:hypothetical protein n=1 Tax=Acinetobacter guillouiae TaxID=106649 RepID=UPI002FDAEECD
MSSKLGTLTLDLVARIGNFTGPIQQAENQANSSFNKMREHANKYGAAIAAVGAGAVVALAGMAVEYADQAVELERMAFKANTTTQEFQKMATGAAAFGIEGEQLADIMKDFNEKLGELTSVGAGGGVDFFEQIAVKTEGSAEAARKLILEMQKLSGPQALQMYVDKLEEAGVTQQQMSFYLESMGSDLTNLIPLLMNGGEGMKLYGDLAQRAGIIMSDETREAAASLKGQIYILDLQLQGTKNQLMQAVIPAFVDIAGAFFDGSEQGLQFSSIADGIAKTLKVVASVAIGAVTSIQLVGKALGGVAAIGGAIYSEMDWYEMNPLGIAKAAWDAREQIAALTTEIKGDMHETVMGAADRLDKMWKGGASESAALLGALQRSRVESKGAANGMNDLVDKQNKAAKSSEKHTKSIKDNNKSLADAQKLLYDYGTEFQKIDYDLVEELNRIQKSSLKDEPKTRMLADAKKISEARKQVALLEYEADLDSWSWTEEKKLEKTLDLEKQKVLATKGMSDGEKKERLKSLEEIHKNQMAWLQLEQAERLSNAQEIFRTDLQNMEARYEIDRAKISKDLTISPEDREVYINASYRSQDRENDSSRRYAWTEYQNEIGIDTSAEDAQSKRNEAIQAAFEWQLITQEEYQAKLLASEQQYQADRASLAFSSGESIAGSFSEMFKTIGGEQSTAYKAMFAIEKGFAIAQSIMAIQTGIANAMSLPFPGNLGAAATVAMETANIVSTIQSVSLVGMAHDGIANVPEEGTWLLSKGERVLNPQDNKALTNMINNGGGGNKVIINNYGNDKVETSQDADGNLMVTIGKMIDGAVDRGIDRNMKQGYPLGKALKGMR